MALPKDSGPLYFLGFGVQYTMGRLGSQGKRLDVPSGYESRNHLRQPTFGGVFLHNFCDFVSGVLHVVAQREIQSTVGGEK